MFARSVPLAALLLVLSLGVSAQPATDLRTDPDVLAELRANSKTGPTTHFGPNLNLVRVAYQVDKEQRALGGATRPFAERVGLAAVRGEAVLIDAYARADGEAAALAADLAALGFEETGRFRHVVSGFLPLDALDDAAALPTLRSADASLAVGGRGAPEAVAALAGAVGSVEGEASVALRADNARTLFGVDGTGLTIGVMSDSFDACTTCATDASDDVASGDLPMGITVLDDLAPGTGSDGGRAMMQLAYDVAPGVDFSFHTAFGGIATFAGGIGELVAAGADIVVDNITTLTSPIFQDGLIAQAADAAFATGVPFFSLAGNQSDSGYAGTFTDSGVDFFGDLHDFDPDPGSVDAFQEIVIPTGASIQLAFHYDEPSVNAGAGQAPTSDYDFALLDGASTGAGVLAASAADNTATGAPFEFITYTNATGSPETVHLVIIKFSGDDRRISYINFDGSSRTAVAGAEYNGAHPTLIAHHNAEGAFAVGAGAWFNAPTAANGLTEAVVNGFTSFGGQVISLEPDGTRLVSTMTRSKPDAAATDGDNNTFFGGDTTADPDALPNFFGTNAAAPNLAAVAALMIEAAGGSLPPVAIYGTLKATAEDIVNTQGFNPDTGVGYDLRSGSGMVRADRAVASVAASPLAVVINEVDLDQASTDTEEFVELHGPANLALDGLVLVGINGVSDTAYGVIDLDGQALGADGLHVTCGGTVAGCDLDLPINTDLLQNDAEGLALALGEDFDYTNSRFQVPDPADRVDALLHAVGGTAADAPDAGLIAALGETITYDEAIGGDSETDALARLNGAAYANGASDLFYALPPSPGVANTEALVVRQTDLADLAGFRLLATPFVETRTAGGVDVTDVTGGTAVGQLAAIDLVQGVPAGTTFPAEYADADDVLFVSYDGTANYGSPATTDEVLVPGQGFFWYWFDNDFGPVAGGTSQSHDVPSILLALGGIPNEGGLTTPAFPETADGFYMLGNPYPHALGLDGIGTTAGALSSGFQIYDPNGNTFDIRTSTADVAALQGVFAQIMSGPGSGGTGGNPAFTFDASAIDADLVSPSGDFAGRDAVEGRLALRLEGRATSGERLADGAALLRLLAEGTPDWDRHDMSKLSPPGHRALLAPVGEREGSPHRQAALSLPSAFEGEVPVALEATLAGQFEITWTLTDMPDALDVRLTDRATGAVVDLRAADRYAFEAAETAWDDRFVLTLGDPLVTATEDGRAEAFIGRPFPNPTVGAAHIGLRVAKAGPVRITVLDMLGREVAVIHDGDLAADVERRLALDTRGLAAGTYFVRVIGPDVSETRRLSVVR